jgi:hypothetical protein
VRSVAASRPETLAERVRAAGWSIFYYLLPQRRDLVPDNKTTEQRRFFHAQLETRTAGGPHQGQPDL